MLVLKFREQVIAAIAGLLVFSLAWTYFVIQPICAYQADLDTALKEKSLKLYEAKKVLDGQAAKSSMEFALKKFYSDGLPQEEMSRMIKEIESAAAADGLQVVETKPQPLVQNSGWYELKINIVFEGRWIDIAKFLYQLDGSSKPLLINEITLESTLAQQLTIRGRLEIRRLLITKAS